MSQVSFITAYCGRWISDNLFSDFAFQALEVYKDIDIDFGGTMLIVQTIGDREGLVMVSDQKCSIPTAVELVYPADEHGICIQHLLRNLIGRFKGLKVDGLFYRCGKLIDLRILSISCIKWNLLRMRFGNTYLKLGMRSGLEHFLRQRRYNVLTTNIYESMNAVLLEAKKSQADETPTHLTARADRHLRDMEAATRPMNVHLIDVSESEIVNGRVNNMVNLIKRTCSCLVWQSDEFPCSHAVTAIWKRKLEPADFASVYFRNSVYRETYNAVVYLLGGKSNWNVFEDLLNANVPTPNNRCSAGRPRMERNPSAGEGRTQLRCSKCNNFNHNKRICKNLVPSAMGASFSKKIKSYR
ncbi:hypothetical protein TIFTF001_027725 [Ficus carica]|uniref:SWIM-type domain-containing protein n=1 Tax=Ficus carica TaxID=3494 RepID=A0AA88DNI6_FICCA|nr:hypothetical protein TIFTF001_027725 [Ficus carica]